MIAGFGIDQLNIHPKPIAASLHGTFEHIADVQLASDLLYIDGFAFEGESGVTRDHE